jgi:hypothetical protein
LTDLPYSAVTVIYVYTCYLLRAGFLPGSFSALKIEALCSSDKSVEFQRTTRRYVPEDRTPHENGTSKSLKAKGIYLPADQTFSYHGVSCDELGVGRPCNHCGWKCLVISTLFLYR